MKKILLSSFCAVSAILVCFAFPSALPPSSKNGDTVIDKTYEVKEYSALKAYSGFDVSYSIAPRRSVKIEVPKKALDYVRVYVEGGQLVIGIDRNNTGPLLNNVKLKATVSGPVLTQIEVSSGADVWVGNMISSGNLTLSSSSGGSISLENLGVSKLNVSASSGSDINVRRVNASDIKISVSSGADVDMTGVAAKSLTASSSSGADLLLKGMATDVSFTASSAGSIKASELKSLRGKASATSVGTINCNVINLDKSTSSGGSISN